MISLCYFMVYLLNQYQLPGFNSKEIWEMDPQKRIQTTCEYKMRNPTSQLLDKTSYFLQKQNSTLKNKLKEFVRQIEDLGHNQTPDYHSLQEILEECISKMRHVVSPIKQPTIKTKLVIDT